MPFFFSNEKRRVAERKERFQQALNAQDAGGALTRSGDACTLRQVGLCKGSAEWDRVLYSEAPFTLTAPSGSENIFKFQWRISRQMAHDLKGIRGTRSWINQDSD